MKADRWADQTLAELCNERSCIRHSCHMATLLNFIYKNGPNLIEEINACLAQGEDVNHITKHGESALRVASNRGRFDAVKRLLEAQADRSQLDWSPTIHEVVHGSCASIQKSVQENQDLEATDCWERTPFLFAVHVGSTEKAQLLLDLGANQKAQGRCGKTPMQYAVERNDVGMLQWLLDKGFDLESTDDYLETPLLAAATHGRADCAKFLIQNGANIHKADHIQQRPIEVATSLEVVRILVSHGADINDISSEMHAMVLGIEEGGEPQASPRDFAKGKERQFGKLNPEPMDKPFWLAMVRSGASGWAAHEKFFNPGGVERPPVWCYQRFGRSTTILDDGRILEIGGEHEDHYDPDFCIYNDVTEFNTDGVIRIFGYPEQTFPPTDFHTATLFDGFIVIIGCLGYPQARRFGHTPVYRLNVSSLEIEEVPTTGDGPGWIHRHKTRLDGRNCAVVSGGHIEVGLQVPSRENVDEWALDLTNWVWTRRTNRQWAQWTFVRSDKKPNHLWEIRQALWSRDANWKEDFAKKMQELVESLGHAPDIDSLGSLYHVDGLTSHNPKDDKILTVHVDGVAIRMKEDHWQIHAMVEGHLQEEKLRAFQEGVLEKLAWLEGTAWDVNMMRAIG